MDIREIRRINIRTLIALHDGVSAFAERFNWHQGQVSSWASETLPKNIGANLARRIEIATGQPEFWLDQDHSSNSSQSVRVTDDMIANALKAAQDIVEMMGQTGTFDARQPTDAAIVARVLTSMMERGSDVFTDSDKVQFMKSEMKNVGVSKVGRPGSGEVENDSGQEASTEAGNKRTAGKDEAA